MELKKYLQRANIKGSEFAESIGCSKPALSLYMSGARKPRPDIANKIVKATKGAVSFADLYADRS